MQINLEMRLGGVGNTRVRGLSLNDEQRRWLADLYQAHSAAVFRLCARILGSPDDAADASQEVFLIALKSLAPDTPGAKARSWLLTVARNRCIDLIRQRKRVSRTIEMVGVGSDPGPDLETSVADRDLIQGLFAQLSLRERQALWQSAVERRPLGDIAAGLRLNYMATAQVLHRARLRASTIAGRVAVLIGLAHLGRLFRRAYLAQIRLVSALQRRSGSMPLPVGPRLLIAAVLPLLAVTTIQVASAHPGGSPARQRSALPIKRSLVAPAAAGQATSTAPGATPTATGPVAPSSPTAGTAGPLGQQSPLGSLVADVGRAAGQLPHPAASLPALAQPSALPALPSLPPVPLASPLAVPTLLPTPIPLPH